jgi:hypothetical protein
MSEPEPPKNPFPALEQASRLSEFLCEGDFDEFTLTQGDEEAAQRLQETLVHRLRTVHHSQWPQPQSSRKGSDQTENQPNVPLGITAP